MSKSKKNIKVDEYLNSVKRWQEELRELRRIALSCGLSEELKWGVPWYTFDKKPIVGLYAFKNHAALLFLKGALLKDPNGILVKPGENSESARQVRFHDLVEIKSIESVLKKYIVHALEVERAGVKVITKKKLIAPDELQYMLDKDPAFKTAFEALTPGRQKGYIIYFSAAKRSKTRMARIEKYADQILDGIGLHDQYN